MMQEKDAKNPPFLQLRVTKHVMPWRTRARERVIGINNVNGVSTSAGTTPLSCWMVQGVRISAGVS